MDKDLLEVQRKNLSNLLKECDENKVLLEEEQFTYVYTYDAISMEGKNKIPFEDVKRLIKHKTLPEYSEREQKEVLNHVKAFEWVKKYAGENRDVTEDMLKDLHELLVDGIFQGGVYRNVNIQIIGATHQPPDYVKVYDRMAKVFRNLADFEGTPIERAVYINAAISKIHPFLDANGRVARLLMNYYLIKAGYLPVSVPVGLREEYFKNLEIFKIEKNLTPLVEFITGLLVKRYENIINNLEI